MVLPKSHDPRLPAFCCLWSCLSHSSLVWVMGVGKGGCNLPKKSFIIYQYKLVEPDKDRRSFSGPLSSSRTLFQTHTHTKPRVGRGQRLNPLGWNITFKIHLNNTFTAFWINSEAWNPAIAGKVPFMQNSNAKCPERNTNSSTQLSGGGLAWVGPGFSSNPKRPDITIKCI